MARTATTPTTTFKLIKQLLHHSRQPYILRSSFGTATATATSRPRPTGAPKPLLLSNPKQDLKERLRLALDIPVRATSPATSARGPAAPPGALAQPLTGSDSLVEVHQLADEGLLVLLAGAILMVAFAGTLANPLIFDADTEEFPEECFDLVGLSDGRKLRGRATIVACVEFVVCW